MAQLKQLVTDSLLQLAVILSLLRTDISSYLQQYSRYPEVQQALNMGETLGIQLVDNYHENAPWTIPSKFIDDRETIFNDINRFMHLPNAQQNQVISTWLVTNESSPLVYASVFNESQPSTSRGGGNPARSTDLTHEDMELIDILWKQDMDMGISREMFDPHQRLELEKQQELEQTISAEEKQETSQEFVEGVIIDRETGEQISIFNIENPTAEMNTYSEMNLPSRPPFQTQASANSDLEEIDSFISANTTEMVSSDANSSSIEQSNDMLFPNLLTNASGDIWNMPPDTLDDSLPMNEDTNATNTTGMLDELLSMPNGMDLDFDMYTDDVLAAIFSDTMSEDSAVSLGGHSPHSSDRMSFSSDDTDIGATGYTSYKSDLTNNDNGFFDYEPFTANNSNISHNHTYGAPPGGQPHVRKMDMKVKKEPKRGKIRDEKQCKELNIPFPLDLVIDSSVDDFNKLINKYSLSDSQISLIRDIRRRGKNKVAAQNCRKKKINQLSGLDSEIEALRSKRDKAAYKKSTYERQSSQLKKDIAILSSEIFHTLRDENGHPYDPQYHSLELNQDGNIHIVSVNSTSTHHNRRVKKRRAH